MRTPREIYLAYKIMPNLQLHQLRVAAVGKLICDNFLKPIDAQSVILAGLFHDMGNIIKSDFAQLSEFIKPEGAEYWESVKAEFIKTYGDSAHNANVAIAKEIGVNDGVVALINGVSFANMDTIVEGDSYEQKICEYADTRVGPFGVLSQIERLDEARQRSIARGKNYYSEDGFNTLSAVASQLEHQIFEFTKLRSEDIDDASVAPIIEQLWDYPVS
ncbi:MAG: HD domain-containing protein [bacterium]|nr:HD domain-containing protein [bacterium]